MDVPISDNLDQLQFKLEKNIGDLETCRKSYKRAYSEK